jgi:UbiD family decarboxylase
MILTGMRLYLRDFPVPIHHALDGGPYILGGTMVTKDPDTGMYNLAMSVCN